MNATNLDIEKIAAFFGVSRAAAVRRIAEIYDLVTHDRLGSTAHHPLWGVAYKYPAERKTTIVESITVQVANSGKLTPVAELSPIALSGTTVKRATLHNFEDILKKDIRVGDTVFVEKSGDIIPQIKGVQLELRPLLSVPLTPPQTCPCCGGGLVKVGANLFCSSKKVP